MKRLGVREITTIGLFGLVGWALCGAIVFIGMEVTSMQATLITHAIGAPVIFTTLAWLYFTRFGYTSPLATAIVFLGIVVFMDFFLVALVINRSLAMFTSLIGTWVPWVLIFLSTYLTGRYLETRSPGMQRA